MGFKSLHQEQIGDITETTSIYYTVSGAKDMSYSDSNFLLNQAVNMFILL